MRFKGRLSPLINVGEYFDAVRCSARVRMQTNSK